MSHTLARRAFALAALLTLAGAWRPDLGSRPVIAATGQARPASAESQSAPPQPEPAQPERPTFRTEANYVRVDVYPTAGGVPVRDLTRDDFEVFENGAPQRIEQFELIEVQANVPQTERREPQTVAEAREMAQESRSRVFIVFLDTYHTGVGGSHRMRSALISLIDRILGPDDLVGVMTPEMSARDVTLARRTETIEGMLSRHWDWGRRDRVASLDPEEEEYLLCYPKDVAPVTTTPGDPRSFEGSEKTTGVAEEMIARRREKLTLDAMGDLVAWLRGVREERKAVLAISDGWRLFQPNHALANTGNRRAPQPGIAVGPSGRVTTDPARDVYGDPQQRCEADRLHLAELDNHSDFLRLMDRANRSNVSFYPIDSRGLPVFDTSLAGELGQPLGQVSGPPPLPVDQARLRQRLDSLQTLAANTDGIAVVNSNDIERGLTRIVADLSTYYLLGYYSTNTKLDGSFRSIKVRVKRPGVEVRARRGYLAATEAEMSAAPTAAPLETTAAMAAIERAVGGLAALRPDSRVRMQVAWLAGSSSSPGAAGRVWATAELDRTFARGAEWTGGARIEATLAGSNGAKAGATTLDLEAGQRVANLELGDVALAAGEWLLRLRITPASGGLPLVEAVRFIVPATSSAVGAPRLSRRGPTTGQQFVATGDAAFRRNEWIRLEAPLGGEATAVRAELLERTGKTMPLPVAARLAPGTDGVAWAVADLALAPLAAGDYVVRLTVTMDGRDIETLTAFKVVQ